MLTIGLDGPITTRSACDTASSTSSVGGADAAPSKLIPRTSSRWPRSTK